jgi:hypothetical protein
MKPLALIALLFFTACAGAPVTMTLMVHPNGTTVQCQAMLNQDGIPIGQRARTECVRQYELIGFVPVDPKPAP